MKTYKMCTFTLLFAIMLLVQSCSNEDTKNQSNAEIKVKTAKVSNVSANGTFAYSGLIEESESIPMSFSVIGTVSRVYVSEGDYIRKGQLLAELDASTAKSSLEMAEATLKQAEDAYERLSPMYKNGNLPEIKFIEAEANLQKAKAAAAIAKKNADDCKLFAAESGIIGKRSIDPGMIAMPNVTSINIVKIEKVFARIPVPENEISSVKNGQKAKIKISALKNAVFTGIIEEVGVIADPLSHSYKVKAGIINTGYQIKPGMVCNAVIERKDETNRHFIPNKALMVDETGKQFVFSVDTLKNRAVRKYVEVGEILNNGIEIKSGLDADEEIVVSGQQKLVNNSLVRIIKN